MSVIFMAEELQDEIQGPAISRKWRTVWTIPLLWQPGMTMSYMSRNFGTGGIARVLVE